ncbi:parallel beta helix pectate lyase-like protein [Luteimonas cucumeris]|uniref:Parallel beta helix pectate lyase-like protein n=1 Tax=Luteimonas cucumeris TaxID=985012 RepID=A0A562L2M2_9GAMM|nr:right-handed parallel beta-helix repeat-containing protein [Luteimonas cucumeris]TWI01766.1 parallel beta helix pectate lyase-like protein [Luteimonas cucumeris]
MVLAVGALPFGVRPAAAGRTRGNARTSVREHGARGDGIRDDTTSFQAAIDALPADGGTVHVPAGTYLIDPTRSVKLRSRVHLEMAGDATLQAKANAAPRAYVLLAQQLEDVEISGGRIVGDRHSHLGKDGEWGHGIRVRGCTRVTIRNIRISDCWGDGISAGGIMLKGRPSRPGRDLLIDNATCTGNRRQGLTIGSYRGAHVRGGEFSDTGGTAPAAGIDIEPDTDVARDVLIEGCLVRGNRGPGIQLYKRAAAVTIRKCTIERNRGDGILAVTAIDCVFSGNVIRNNGARGVSLRAGSRDVRISDNRFVGNLDGGRRQLRMADDSVAIRIDENNQFE